MITDVNFIALFQVGYLTKNALRLGDLYHAWADLLFNPSDISLLYDSHEQFQNEHPLQVEEDNTTWYCDMVLNLQATFKNNVSRVMSACKNAKITYEAVL